MRGLVLFLIITTSPYASLAEKQSCSVTVRSNDISSQVYVNNIEIGSTPQKILCDNKQKIITVKSRDGQEFIRVLGAAPNQSLQNDFWNVVFQDVQSNSLATPSSASRIQTSHNSLDNSNEILRELVNIRTLLEEVVGESTNKKNKHRVKMQIANDINSRLKAISASNKVIPLSIPSRPVLQKSKSVQNQHNQKPKEIIKNKASSENKLSLKKKPPSKREIASLQKIKTALDSLNHFKATKTKSRSISSAIDDNSGKNHYIQIHSYASDNYSAQSTINSILKAKELVKGAFLRFCEWNKKNDDRTWTQVLVGPFKSFSKATEVLSAIGGDSFILNKTTTCREKLNSIEL